MVSMFLFSVSILLSWDTEFSVVNLSLVLCNLFFSLHTELLLPITLFYIYGNFIPFLCKNVPVLVNSIWLFDFVFFLLFFVSNYAKYFKIVSFKVLYYFKYFSWMFALSPITKIHLFMWFVIIFLCAHSSWEFYPFWKSHEFLAMKVFL